MQTPSEILKETRGYTKRPSHLHEKRQNELFENLTIRLLEGVKTWATVEIGYAEDQIKEEQDPEVKEYLFGKRNVASQLEIFIESQLSEIKKI